LAVGLDFVDFLIGLLLGYINFDFRITY